MADELDIQVDYDVVVIGAGGAGLRAAIECGRGQDHGDLQVAARQGAHGHGRGRLRRGDGQRYPKDNWKIHFRDTMRGGKFLNNWRMAELHAKEAPDRVRELEEWGAVFDRTPDGLHSASATSAATRYPRLAHVGDRTGLEMIRTLQQKVVSLQQEDAREHGDPERTSATDNPAPGATLRHSGHTQ